MKMDWSGVPGAVILGVSGLLVISLLFWSGHALLNLLGEDIPIERSGPIKNEPLEPFSLMPDRKPLADGEERLATQEERDDVNEITRTPDLELEQPRL